ncbi:helix-turn-helix domain-containing protein [Alteromonas stellipolaris]|uniref:helix-turn-helix domain-containing protein n=1 Tax=Alteromonas stellipolaris TaxID=233316 RepID=UPI0026E42FB6|nr:helix-turn-helix domain-containing protein [Alteromonas stellipolaris]MDO6534075.1 helix-turn-helix domain-containing protein [Alteromonas stellipolaris]MDO6626031.1 helix-turn-helix domain-containing protein [Alteromonas stellipolaris]
MTRRFTANRIKSNRNYTVLDISETLGVHYKTVRNWIRAGLPVIDSKRPLLINGADLKIHLKQKRRATIFDCENHEMCCFRCKQPMKPLLESVLFIAKPAGMAHMTGVCEECGTRMNKYVSWRDVNNIWKDLKGKLPIAEKHIVLRGQKLLNCPFSEVSSDEK